MMRTVRVDGKKCHKFGVRVAECKRFKGLCLESMQAFTAGELIYKDRAKFYKPTTTVVVETELGDQVISPENVLEVNDCDHGYVFAPELFAYYSPNLLRRLAQLCQTPPENLMEIYLKMSKKGTKNLVISSFGEMANHADDPNMTLRLDQIQLRIGGSLELRYFALRDIAPGEELAFDYREIFPLFQKPAHW